LKGGSTKTMGSSIPREFIDQLVSDSDIVAVLSNYLKLTKRSSNYITHCPFHDEKTPSFTVSPQKQIYHCFGCGKGGNVITFLQEYEGLNFVEAVERLAEFNNVTVPRSSNSNRLDHSEIYELNNMIADFYFSALKNKKYEFVVDYLKQRGVNGETAKKFTIGYADFDQHDLLAKLKEKFSEETILKSGNFLKNEKGIYPFYRKRLMFPIKNHSGNIIGFGGRTIDDSLPKYLNSKDSPFFNKSRELYGFNNAKQDHKSDYFIVTEGYMDVIMLSQHDVNNAVASLGTAFSLAHLQNLFKLKKKIVFCFDSDEAGLKAAWRSFQFSLNQIFEDRTIRFLFLPEGEDPDSYIQKNGREEFEKRISRSMQLESFAFQYLKRGRDLNSPEDIRTIIFELKKLLQSLKSDALKQTLIKKFSDELNISQELLLTEDAPQAKKVIQRNKTPEKHDDVVFVLIIYIYDHFLPALGEKSTVFLDFLKRTEKEELSEFKKIIFSLASDGQEHKETSLYSKAAMVEFSMTDEEAIAEFDRAADTLRLKNDSEFTEYLKNLAKKRDLTQQRKENLQKLLNLSDNISTQEEELIQFLNTYS
jgi:DNA primase